MTRRLLSLVVVFASLGASVAAAQTTFVAGQVGPVVTDYGYGAVFSPPPSYYAPVARTAYYAPVARTTYYVAPAPTVTYYAPAPTVSYYAPAPTVTYYTPSPVVRYYAPPTVVYRGRLPRRVYYAAPVVVAPY